MKIETKYSIGDAIWVVDTNNRDEVVLYRDIIKEVSFKEDIECTPMGNTNKTEINYYGDKCPCEIKEDEVVLYNDNEALVKRIIKLEREINFGE